MPENSVKPEYDFSNARRGPVVARPAPDKNVASEPVSLSPLEREILEDAEHDQYGFWEVGAAVRSSGPGKADAEVVAEAQALLRRLYDVGLIDVYASDLAGAEAEAAPRDVAIALLDDIRQFEWPNDDAPRPTGWFSAARLWRERS